MPENSWRSCSTLDRTWRHHTQLPRTRTNPSLEWQIWNDWIKLLLLRLSFALRLKLKQNLVLSASRCGYSAESLVRCPQKWRVLIQNHGDRNLGQYRTQPSLIRERPAETALF